MTQQHLLQEEQCTYVCRTKTPWIPWNTQEGQFDLTTASLPQGASSVRVLNPPEGFEGIGFDDLQHAYTARTTGTGG